MMYERMGLFRHTQTARILCTGLDSHLPNFKKLENDRS